MPFLTSYFVSCILILIFVCVSEVLVGELKKKNNPKISLSNNIASEKSYWELHIPLDVEYNPLK